MKRFVKRLLPLLLVPSLLLTGCSGEKAAAVPIQVAIIDDVVSLDPANTKDVISETVARCIFSTLYSFDEEMNLVPSLAESGERVSDLDWVFHLRKNATFHDGGKLTASDVKFSIERAQTAEKADNSLAIITGLEVVDDATIRMTTEYGIPNLPSLLVRASASIMSEKAMSEDGYSLDLPIGSGAFQVVKRVAGEGIYLRRYDGYYAGSAKTELLNFIVEPSEQSGTAAILNGTADILYRVSANDGDYLDLNEDVTLYQTDSPKVELLLFNTENTPMSDIRVRQAIAFAINKQNIVDNVLDGYGRVLNSMLPAPLPGNIDFDDYAYDPDRARALLTEAGYPDGFAFTVLTFDVQRKKLMEYLKLDMAKVNITLNYEFLELKDYLDLVEKRSFMGSVMSWTSNPDPDSTFTQLYSQAGHPTVNQSSFYDPEVEELLQRGRIETDSEARRFIYEEINRIVAESYNAIPLYQAFALVAARSEIKGVRINAQGLFGYDSLYRES